MTQVLNDAVVVQMQDPELREERRGVKQRLGAAQIDPC